MSEGEIEKLFAAFGYFLHRRALVCLGDPRAAQAIVFESFVELARAGALEGDPLLRLRRIVDRRCLEALHSGSEREPAAEASLAEAVGDDARDSFVTVRKLLSELEPESLRLALLYYLDELTEEELARELELSRRTVQKRVRALLGRARALLREESAP